MSVTVNINPTLMFKMAAVLQESLWHAHPVYESPKLIALQESDDWPNNNENISPKSLSPHPLAMPAGVSVFQQ